MRAFGARSRCRSTAIRSRARSRWESIRLPNMIQPQFSWAFDPVDSRTRYDPPRADAAVRRRRLAPRCRRPAPARRRACCASSTCSFPSRRPAFALPRPCRPRCASAASTLSSKSVSNAQLFLPQYGRLGDRHLRSRLRSVDDGRRSRRLRGPRDAARLQLHALVRRNASTRSNAGRSRRPSERRASGSTASIASIVARDVPILYLFNADYVYAYRKRLHGFAPNAFLPTWNAFAWRLMR